MGYTLSTSTGYRRISEPSPVWNKKIPSFTPPKTNMEPENEPLEEEIPMKNHHF